MIITLNIRKMKTRMIAVALFTLLSFTAFSGTGREINGSDSSCPGNILKCQGMAEAGLMNDAANLDEWFVNRDIWEQTSEEMMAASSLIESTSIEEWIDGRENWEQFGEVKAIETAFSGPCILDQWITGVESWEKE